MYIVCTLWTSNLYFNSHCDGNVSILITTRLNRSVNHLWYSDNCNIVMNVLRSKVPDEFTTLLSFRVVQNTRKQSSYIERAKKWAIIWHSTILTTKTYNETLKHSCKVQQSYCLTSVCHSRFKFIPRDLVVIVLVRLAHYSLQSHNKDVVIVGRVVPRH